MTEHPPSIWSKVDYDLPASPSARPSPETSPEEKARRKKRRKRAVTALDLIATFFWVYALLKVFVTDVDRELASHIAPSLEFLVDFRFFLFLGAVAVIVLAFKKRLFAVAALAYVACFPLIVLFWKVPRLLYRSKSWLAAFAAINAVSSFFADLRYSVVFLTLTAFSVLGIVAGRSDVVVGGSAMALSALLLVSIGRTLKLSLAASRFLEMQQTTIQRVVDSEPVRQLTSVNDDLRRADIEKFNPEQQQAFVQSLTMSVIAHRGLLYWAHQLEQYRRSPASLLYSTLAYISLFVRVVAGLALINYGVYQVDPDAYTRESDPSVFVFVRYSMIGLYGGEIDALRPASDIANVLSIAAFFIGVVILATLVLTWVLNYRHSRDQTTITATISQIRGEGRRLEERMRSEYEITAEEAIERLKTLRAALLGVVLFFTERLPADLEDDSPPASPEAGGAATS